MMRSYLLRGRSERIPVASDVVTGLVIFLNFSMRRLGKDRKVLRMLANMNGSDLHGDEESEPEWQLEHTRYAGDLLGGVAF